MFSPSPFSWWAGCAVLEYHDPHAEAGRRASWSRCLNTQELHEGLIPWTAVTSCLGFFRPVTCAVFLQKAHFGGEVSKNGKGQESCYPLWSINEVSGLTVCVPTLWGPLCITSRSVFPRRFEEAARLPRGLLKDVLDGQGKRRTLGGAFQRTYFLLVLQETKSYKIKLFLTILRRTASRMIKDEGNTWLLRAHYGIISNTALCGYLTAAWNHYKAAHTYTKNTNTDAYCICIQALCKIQWKQHPPCCWFSEIKSILIYQSYNIHPKHLATFLNETNSFASVA